MEEEGGTEKWNTPPKIIELVLLQGLNSDPYGSKVFFLGALDHTASKWRPEMNNRGNGSKGSITSQYLLYPGCSIKKNILNSKDILVSGRPI